MTISSTFDNDFGGINDLLFNHFLEVLADRRLNSWLGNYTENSLFMFLITFSKIRISPVDIQVFFR